MKRSVIFVSVFLISLIIGAFTLRWDDSRKEYAYDDFQSTKYCKSCHESFFQQWDQSMMAHAYDHHWDEIEYFELAVPHGEKVPELKEATEGCNGCHTPMAWVVGDIPPPRPEKNSRANESVSCEVCHLRNPGREIDDTSFNYDYTLLPGNTKYNSRQGKRTSPNHEIKVNERFKKGEFCGTCHNEKSPFGVWVKSTVFEWKEGPYYEQGVQCQDCHMPRAKAKTAKMGAMYDDARLHLFNGAHDPGKLRGVIEIRIIPDISEVVPGEPVIITLTLYNQKTGHKFPTGSVEDRIVWLHVEAVDAGGKKYHLPVDKKGFEGEKYTIGSKELAYQDIGVPLGIENFEGVERDGIPVGDRIFRMPFFDPEGRMTMMQWNTKSLGVDYRIGPRETIMETYTFNVPFDIEPGKLKIKAKMYYQLLVTPVAKLLKVPEEEYTPHLVNEAEYEIEILP